MILQENPRFEVFENFLSIKPFETHSIEILPISAIFKKFQQFFKITNLLSRKSQAFERFQFSWAIILFETQAGMKMLRSPILEKNKDLFKDNIYFSKQTKFLIVLRIPKHYETLTRNLDKKCQIVLLKSFKDIFAKNVTFLKKISSFELLEIAWSIITFGKHSEGKYPCLKFLKTFKCSFEKKTSLFAKNPCFWTSSKHMTNSKVQDVFEKKKLAKLSVFESFETFFSSDLFIFPKRAKFWKFGELLGSEYFLYVF